MANIDTSALRNISDEITNILNTLKTAATTTESSCETLYSKCTEFKNYNGNKIKEGQYIDKPSSESKDSFYNYNTVSTNDGDIGDKSKRLADFSTEILEIVDGISNHNDAIDIIADAIDSYIKNVESNINNGNNYDSSLYSLASLAIGREEVKMSNVFLNGQRLSYEEFKNAGLSDKNLTFQLQSDGTYKIYSNDEETEYYINGLTAAFYQKTLMQQAKSKLNDTKNSSSENDSNLVEMQPAPDEIKVYASKDEHILAGTYKKTDHGYQRVVDSDGNVNVESYTATTLLSANIDIPKLIDNKQDIIIPKGKNLYISNKKACGDDYILRHDPYTNQYRVVKNDGEFANGGYDLSELTNIEIK